MHCCLQIRRLLIIAVVETLSLLPLLLSSLYVLRRPCVVSTASFLSQERYVIVNWIHNVEAVAIWRPTWGPIFKKILGQT